MNLWSRVFKRSYDKLKHVWQHSASQPNIKKPFSSPLINLNCSVRLFASFRQFSRSPLVGRGEGVSCKTIITPVRQDLWLSNLTGWWLNLKGPWVIMSYDPSIMVLRKYVRTQKHIFNYHNAYGHQTDVGDIQWKFTLHKVKWSFNHMVTWQFKYVISSLTLH